MLKVGMSYTVTIEETNIFANGVCHIDGMTVFVEGAVSSEICDVEITKVFPKYAYAKCTGIHKVSDSRVVPTCSLCDKCGGCTFSNVTQKFENQVKLDYVRTSFRKNKIEAEFEEIVCPVDEKYRNKVVLYFHEGRFGYMARSTNNVVAHNECMLNDAVFDEIAAFTAKELRDKPIRALYMRKSSHDVPQIMVCPIFYKQTDIFSYVASLVKKFPNVRTVLYSVCNDKDFALENIKFKTLYGDGYISDVLCGLSFRISPESFYQVNHSCAQLLYEKAINLAELNESSVCADLFCGTGTIGIIAGKKTGATVYGVEIVEKAVEDAKNNGKANGVKNVHFKAMDAGKFDKAVDVCIIDPPRKGCSKFMLDTLKRLKPKKIVYISCNVDTMARDIRELSEEYKISSPVSVFNLFPRTSHVETVVRLAKL